MMDNIMNTVIAWLKDPFGRKHITQVHAANIQDMYSTKAVTSQTARRLEKKYRHRKIKQTIGGVNPIDQSVLGTYSGARRSHDV